MRNENTVQSKSEAFALRIIKMYKRRIEHENNS